MSRAAVSSTETLAPRTSKEQFLEDARTDRSTKALHQGINPQALILLAKTAPAARFISGRRKEATQRGHNAERFANIKARTGSVPTSAISI
jgi:hypothetical protein